jgi:hypothetical protein
MAHKPPIFGPLDQVAGNLLETWDHQYRFEMNRAERLLLLSKPPNNEVRAKELSDGRILVIYQPSADETAEEYCSVERAGQLIEALMAREKLEPVMLGSPANPPTPTAWSSWLGRLFG